MPEGEASQEVHEPQKLPVQPIDAGIRRVGDALGPYGEHLVRRPEHIKRISVGEYPPKPSGEHAEAIVVVLDTGQVVAVRSIADGREPKLTSVYQQLGGDHGAPILSLMRKPGDHVGNPAGRDVIRELLQELGTPETVQPYETPPDQL